MNEEYQVKLSQVAKNVLRKWAKYCSEYVLHFNASVSRVCSAEITHFSCLCIKFCFSLSTRC